MRKQVSSQAVPKINDSCIVYILILLFLSTTYPFALVKIQLQPATELATWQVRISMHQLVRNPGHKLSLILTGDQAADQLLKFTSQATWKN